MDKYYTNLWDDEKGVLLSLMKQTDKEEGEIDAFTGSTVEEVKSKAELAIIDKMLVASESLRDFVADCGRQLDAIRAVQE